MKKYGLIIGVLVVIYFFCIVISAHENETEAHKFSTTVQLDISSTDEGLRKLIYSYIIRNLRGFDDIKLVPFDPKEVGWVFSIIAIESRDADGGKTGNIVMSIVLAQRRTLSSFFLKELTEEGKELYGAPSTYFVKHDAQSIKIPELDVACAKLVQDFNYNCVNPERKIWQEIIEEFQERGIK